jgi:glucose-6-phosphate isomerase
MMTLTSGFVFDYSHLYGDNLVTAADITAFSRPIAAAQKAIVHMRATGEVRGHLSKDGTPEKVLFTQLPYVEQGHLNSPQSIQRLKEFGQSLRYQVDTVVHFGIGGSYLGNKVLFDIHGGEFWNSKDVKEREGYPKLYFSGNNIDPQHTADLIAHLKGEASQKAEGPYRVTLIVASKSGGTLDTMASFMVIYGALEKLEGIEVGVVAVTDPAEGENATILKKLATANGWPCFAVPDGVGGRFSIFSEVGLVTAACLGIDMDAFLAGAQAMDKVCQNSNIWDNPALLNAVLKYIAAEKYGLDMEVFMPYGDYLKSMAEWYVQLLAESLGKRLDRSGQQIFYGRTPIVAVGTTDMHAQTQQHQDGKRNKVIQFVKIGSWPEDAVIPDVFPAVPELSKFASLKMSQALNTALAANAAALNSDHRPNALFVLPKLNAFHVGELLYMLALSVAYEGELADVDAFDQPGVEAYKKIMGPKLAALKGEKR